MIDIKADFRYYYLYLYQKNPLHLVFLYQFHVCNHSILLISKLYKGFDKFVLDFKPLNPIIVIYYIIKNKIASHLQLILFQVVTKPFYIIHN